MSAPAKPKHRTTNWKEYNEALRARGSLLVWLDKDMRWHGGASGKRGRSPKYNEAAIQFCLTMKSLFNLPLRQAMGMTQSLLGLAGLDWRSGRTRRRRDCICWSTAPASLDATRRLGRKIWKKWTGYHRRSLVETKMRCFKLLGERVMARDFDRQVAELQVRAAILNRFTRLGTPTTVVMP